MIRRISIRILTFSNDIPRAKIGEEYFENGKVAMMSQYCINASSVKICFRKRIVVDGYDKLLDSVSSGIKFTGHFVFFLSQAGSSKSLAEFYREIFH